MITTTYKRLLLLAALPALLLASCSREEMDGGQGSGPDTQDGEIRFEIGFAPMGGAVQTAPHTRVATDTKFNSTWEEGDEIGIYAVKHGTVLAASSSGNYIHNAKLTYTNGKWEIEEDIYWPQDGTKLDFYAYHPYAAAANNPTSMAFSVDADQSATNNEKSNYNLSDLLMAKTTKADGYGKGETVPLSFTHALAMVQVNVGKSMVGDYPADMLNVWLNGCTTDGVLNLSTRTVTRPLSPASPEKIKMYPCPNDDASGIYAYRALVPAQEIVAGTVLFSFGYGGGTLLRSDPLNQPLSLVAGRAETFDMTFPFTSVTVSATKRLAGLFTDAEFAAITHLKVMGEMTEEDFNTIKSKMTAITNLDLGGATVTGDVTVTYKEGKVKGNAIPCDALLDKGGLKEFIFPRNITVIGDGAFYGCNGLTGTLTIPTGVTTIGGGAFSGCSGFTALSLPESLTTIGGYAFCDCSGFTGTLTIPGSVETIRSGTFIRSGFSTVFISSGVTSIESTAFNNCDNLTTLTIPASVVEIEYTAFDACFAIKSITCHITDLSNTAFDTDLFDAVYDVAFVYVPAAAITDYQSHPMWGKFKSIQAIPEP